TVFNFLTYGTTAVVARASGAGQSERAARLAAQALWVSLGIGFTLLVLGEAVAEPLLRGLGANGKSGEYALTYFRIAAVGLPAASVCARMGDAQIGAHQIAYQLFIFLALVLDAVAIAGQVIVGRMLGAGNADGAFAAAARMIEWSVLVGGVFAAVLLPLAHVIPRAFTGDHSVLHEAGELWPYFALMQPLGGAVFALDGILIGASDTA